MAGIYIHIPFCKQACHYCDFHFSTNTGIRQQLLQGMSEEIKMQAGYLHHEPLDTIYFGGGTPSILTIEEVNELLIAVNDAFAVNNQAEITLEANPDDLTPVKLGELKVAGINRLSIGIQAFQDDILKFLNRAHSASEASECVKEAKKAGFENISIDLIYGIPGLSNDAWKANIGTALDLDPSHLSAYALTVEEKTPFGRWQAQGKLKAVDEEIVARQLEILTTTLENAGYEQYEISNFCKPGKESRHNSSYWKQVRYLGIGPSAHSYNLLTRQYNISNNHLYVRSMKEGKIPFQIETLRPEDHINEYLLTTLRTRWGCDLKKLREEFNYDVMGMHGSYINDLLMRNFAVVEQNFLKLTGRGRLIADKISSDLFLVS